MKLSKTSEYAIRILSYMARDTAKLHSAKSLVEKLCISDKYLRKLMTLLSKSGFIESIQGRYGGYRFIKNVKEIRIYDIVSAVDEPEKYFGCILGFETCSDENPCSMHEAWVATRNNLLLKFKESTLYEISKAETVKV